MPKYYESPNAAYYDRFFDFDKMGCEELGNFISPLVSPELEIPHLTDIRRKIIDDFNDCQIDFAKDQSERLTDEAIVVLFITRGIDKFGGDATHFQNIVRRRLYEALDHDLKPYIEEKLGDRDLLDLLKEMSAVPERVFFRGQGGVGADIEPTIFARQKAHSPIPDCKGIMMSREMIFAQYGSGTYSGSLISRYNSLHTPPVKTPDDMDCQFFAFMEDSGYLSPFVGFTEDPSKAIADADCGKMKYGEAAVYVLRIPDSFLRKGKMEIDKAVGDMESMTCLHRKIVPGSTMRVSTYSGEFTQIDFSTYEDIIRNLSPKFAVMYPIYGKTKKGKWDEFALFDNRVTVDGKVFRAFQGGATLTKIKI